MRIVLDLQGAQTESRYRGIGRYTLSLAKAIIRNAGEHEVLIVLNGLLQESISSIRLEFANLLPSQNIYVWHALGPVNESDANNQWRRESAELIREAFIQSLAPDVVHIPSFFEGYIDNAVTSIGLFDTCTPVSVTMLDLIPLLNPEQYLDTNPAYKAHYLRKIEQIKSAKKLFAISESARQEALENLPFKTTDVLHQSIAVEPFFKNLKIHKNEHYIRRLALGINKPFVLYTGGADTRKNLPRLIHAYRALPLNVRKKYQLVFAGRMPEGNVTELRLIAKQSGLAEEELCFTGYISDSSLVELYNLCELFVFPSWHEGFGLPVLEAMTCGAPAIAANTSSLPEVIGISEALFCPYSIFDMSNKIYLALTDSGYRKRLKKNNLIQVEKFSWDDIAKNTIKSLENMKKENPISIKKSANEIFSLVEKNISQKNPLEISSEVRMTLDNNLNSLKSNNNNNKTLFIDISELVQRDAATGIQRVTRSLLLELIKNPIENYKIQPVFATPEHQGYYCANSYIKNNKISQLEIYNNSDKLIEYNRGDIYLGLDLQQHVVIAQKNILSKMRNDGVYISFIVYDLLPILMPHTFPEGVEEIHKQWLTIIAEMNHLICISKSVKNELSAWLRCQEQISKPYAKISWFHLGADIENSIPSLGLPEQAENILEIINAHKSFLCVGTLEPRKGQSQVLSAFEILWQQNHAVNLILVGKQGWHVDDLIARIQEHPELNKRLFWFDSISDEFLEKIYSKVSCLIAASEGEGFGLPIIEAMKFNLPIVARDIPVFREIIKKNASYFTGTTAYSLAKPIESFILLNKNNKETIDYRNSWLTWFESAQKIKNILLENHSKKTITKQKFEDAYHLSSQKKQLISNEKLLEINYSLALDNKKILKKIEKMEKKIIAKKASIEDLKRSNIAITELKEKITNQNLLFEKNTIETEEYKSKINSIQQEINTIKKSTSWRITYPLRLASNFIHLIISLPKRATRFIARNILKATILIIIKIKPLRNWLSNKLKKHPELYNHLRRFSINRNILSENSSKVSSQPTVYTEKNDPLRYSAENIYKTLKSLKK